MKTSEYIKKLESCYRRRVGVESLTLFNVRCEACQTNIPRYHGPVYGILCKRCLEPNNDVLLYYGNRVREDFTGANDYE